MSGAKTVGRAVPSWGAYALSLGALFFGFIFASFVPAAPFEYFSWGVVGLATSYFAKRVIDKKFKSLPGTEPGTEIDPNAGGLG
jgi:hypothetical protein